MTTRTMVRAVFLTLVLVHSASPAARAQRRRGAYQLTGGPDFASTAQPYYDLQGVTLGTSTITSPGLSARVQVAPEPIGSKTVRVGGYLGIELGYGKVSSSQIPGYADRMPIRLEAGAAVTHHRPDTDLSLYVYVLGWHDEDFLAPAVGGQSLFYMAKAAVRHRRFLAEVARSLKPDHTPNEKTLGSLLDCSVVVGAAKSGDVEVIARADGASLWKTKAAGNPAVYLDRQGTYLAVPGDGTVTVVNLAPAVQGGSR